MEAKDLVLHNCSERQIVEQVGQVLPNVRIPVLAQTLVVKAVHLSNLPTLMIASQNSYSIWISYLKSNKQRNCFYRIVTSIYVVTHK